MKAYHMSTIYRTRDDLRECGTVPVDDYEIIAERLVITCKRHTDHRRRRKGGRGPRDLRSKYQESKAQKAYSKVLEDDPHIFIPFIMDISPRICESFDILKFCETHTERHEIRFDEETKTFLEQTARRKDIDESLPFKKLMRILFPPPTPRPITGAETQDHYAYYLAELTSIRNFFGDRIYEAVKSSSTRIKENDLNPERTTTESVWTKIPRADNEDAIVHLDVGGAFELASDLFPQARQKVSSALSTHRLDTPQSSCLQADAGLSKISGPLNEYDNAYFTLHGASNLAISSVFSQRVSTAITNSQLRYWEKQALLLETTDCVTMKLWRSQPQHGVICLRIGFFMSTLMANSLYG